MMGLFGKLVSVFMTSGLDRVLSTVDKKIEATTDREAVKADIIKTSYQTRTSFMEAGGFILMAAFVAPLVFWWGAVCVYSVLWCANCAFPQSWTVAALPAPVDEWAGVVVISLFGVVGVTKFVKR